MKKTVMLINDSLMIKLSNGKIINFSPADQDLYNEVLSITDDTEIERLIQQKVSENNPQKASDVLKDNSEEMKYKKLTLSDLNSFRLVGDEIYLDGAPFPLPSEMITQFYGCTDGSGINESYIDRFEALKNFWYLCCLNPNEAAREKMFEFLQRTGFKIMSNGMAMGYRKVVSNGADAALVKFVSNQYLKTVAIRKENPADYSVIKCTWMDTEEYEEEVGSGHYVDRMGIPIYEDVYDNLEEEDMEGWEWIEPQTVTIIREIQKSEYFLYPSNQTLADNEELIGGLLDLYLNLPKIQYETFTDQHTKTFKIKIGEEVTMPREDCDSNGYNDCSAGLHLCSDLSDYASFGDVSLLCAFSPRNVVSVPESTTSKMRVCAYMPLAILEDGEETFLADADTLKLCDEYCVEDLTQVREELRAKDLPGNISISDVNILLTKIDKIREKVKSRVIQY